jgi:spore maturation protein CgeB
MYTPVTIERLEAGETVAYVPRAGLGDFDLVLSFAGGPALGALRTRLGARSVVPLYGAVDPAVHRPAARDDRFGADLSHLGTYAPDRRSALLELLTEPARRLATRRFLLAGAQYPEDFPRLPNLRSVSHVAPGEHAAFFSSSMLSLNVTRAAMARWGWCPSGRLFEAAACGAPLVSDSWEGLDTFFRPDEEILVARSCDDVVAAITAPKEELARMGTAARARVLAEHTAGTRARQLVEFLHGERPARESGPTRDERRAWGRED